jgi:hypothetical protein
MPSRFRCPRIPLVALAAASAACTPFKADLPGDAGTSAVSDAARADASDATMGNASDATMDDASDATMGDASDAAIGDASDAAMDDASDAAMDDASDAAMDDASDAAMDDASDASAQCWHKAPPSRPTVIDAGPSLPDLVFAVSDSSNQLSDGGLPAFKDIGFDLDNTCTGEGQGNSCVEPPWATFDHTDGTGGVDNAYLQAFSNSPPLEVNTPRALFRVRSYNGQSDDDQVEVSTYLARGLAPRAGDGDGGSDGGGTPLWDGNDRFNIMPELLAPSANPSVDEPLYTDHNAYVSGWVIVTHFPTGIGSPGFVYAPYIFFPVSQAVGAGLLIHVGNQWAIQDLVIGMRVRINDVLPAMGLLPDPQNPEGGILCQNAAEYRGYQQYYCKFVDIASTPGPSSAPCDAVSVGGLFQAKQAQFGDVLPPTTPPALPCAPGINETCEPTDD